jgi:hypothetical protein
VGSPKGGAASRPATTVSAVVISAAPGRAGSTLSSSSV